MDFKALRAKRNDKARSLIESSGGKVDSSTWTPDEKLDADAKTGMRPISRRAFKTGGKVEGAEAKGNLSRAPRGFKETVGLANTNQKDANEDREGKKHVGGFKKGGMVEKAGGGGADSGQMAMKEEDHATWRKMFPDLAAEEDAEKASMRPPKRPSPLKIYDGVGSSENDGVPSEADYQMRPPKRPEGLKKGGKAEKKYEGSPKDNLLDARMAKKKGMTHAEWEKSPEDKRMDAKGQREMNQRSGKAGGGGMEMLSPAMRLAKDPKKAIAGGLLAGLKRGGKAEHDEGCSCKACGGAMMGKKDGGGLYANINAKRERGEPMRKAGDKGAPTAEDFKDAKRTARATGGRAKGTTNISINVMPHTPNKPAMGIQPPMPPVGGPPPMMPPPQPPAGGGGGLPPGQMAAMSGAAGTAPPGAGPMPPPPMGRKAGGKVYPKMHFGAGSGEGRLEKIKEYGKNA